MNEIMTGFVDANGYLTPMTLGVLEDIGFKVNYDSAHVTSTGNNFVWVGNQNNNSKKINMRSSCHTLCAHTESGNGPKIMEKIVYV